MRKFVVAALASAVGLLLLLPRGTAPSHSQPDPYWTYLYTWYDVYPSNDWPGWQNGPWRDHNIRYRLCYIPDASNTAGYAIMDWLYQKFSGVLPNGLTIFISYTRVSNCGVPSDLLFWGTDLYDAFHATCGQDPNVIACIWSAEEKWDWFQRRHGVKRADSLAWNPSVGPYPRDAARHVYAHEL